MNTGLARMLVVTLLPVGVLQLEAVMDSGYDAARSLESRSAQRSARSAAELGVALAKLGNEKDARAWIDDALSLLERGPAGRHLVQRARGRGRQWPRRMLKSRFQSDGPEPR